MSDCAAAPAPDLNCGLALIVFARALQRRVQCGLRGLIVLGARACQRREQLCAGGPVARVGGPDRGGQMVR